MAIDEDATDDLGPLLQRVIGDAISDAVAEHEQGFVIKWLALVESSDNNGERGIWAMTSDDVKPWDVTGLLQHALHLQQAQTLADRFEDDDG